MPGTIFSAAAMNKYRFRIAMEQKRENVFDLGSGGSRPGRERHVYVLHAKLANFDALGLGPLAGNAQIKNYFDSQGA